MTVLRLEVQGCIRICQQSSSQCRRQMNDHCKWQVMLIWTYRGLPPRFLELGEPSISSFQPCSSCLGFGQVTPAANSHQVSRPGAEMMETAKPRPTGMPTATACSESRSVVETGTSRMLYRMTFCKTHQSAPLYRHVEAAKVVSLRKVPLVSRSEPAI